MSGEIKEYTLKFHNTYERLAPNYGYETRKDTKEFDFNSNNGKLMYATVSEIISPLLQKVEQLEEKDKEIDRLNNIIDTMLEFSFFKEECPLNFGFGDEKEEKAQDVFYEDDYCEENCNDIYKKCWLKYFEKLQELKEGK